MVRVLSKRAPWALLALAMVCTPALARSPMQRPVLLMNSTMVDPQALTWLSDDGRKALIGAIADLKAGRSYAFVFAAAPGADAWATRSTSKAGDFLSVDDLARNALQTCQFFENGPCYIVSIDGHDARDAFGGYPAQPDFLAGQSGTFSPGKIPFITAAEQVTAGAYASQTGPRAFVVTPSDYWLWRTGKTEFDAIATAYADCQKSAPNQVCVLYAVDDKVVFAPSHD